MLIKKRDQFVGECLSNPLNNRVIIGIFIKGPQGFMNEPPTGGLATILTFYLFRVKPEHYIIYVVRKSFGVLISILRVIVIHVFNIG